VGVHEALVLDHHGVILACRGGGTLDRPVRFPPDDDPGVVHHAPMDEATAFLATLDATAPGRPTACAGWTTHDLVAHLAAGAAEMADLTESVLEGRPPRPTAGFAEREAPFVAMDDTALRARLVTEALRLDAAVGALGTSGGTVAFSARVLTAAQLTLHGRSEAALHRWDLAGDDETSDEILARPELTAHAVDTLNAMLAGAGEDVTVRARAAGITRGRIAFAAPGQPDVVLVVEGAGTRLELGDPSPRPAARAEAATRLLALWGRRSPGRTIAWDTDHPDAGRLRDFLWAPSAIATATPAASSIAVATGVTAAAR